MNPLWLVYHVPKTGGQTIRDHLAMQLTREVDYLHLGKWDREAPLGHDDLAAMSDVERGKIRAISGHPVRRQMADLFDGRPVREVVMLREPAARIVSLYNFTMTMRTRGGEPVIAFDEYVDELPVNQVTGILAKCFRRTQRLGLNDVLHELSRAWLVGRTERLDTILPRLLSSMGLRPELHGRSNVTGVQIERRVTLTPDLAADLRRRNPLDVMLYAATARLERLSLERLDMAGAAAPSAH